jgi:hypothetical protein
MNKRKVQRTQAFMETEAAPSSPVKLGPDIKAKIGQQLRAMYNDVVNQGVPDRFAEVLRRLDETNSDEGDGAPKAEKEGSNGATR